MSQDKEYFTSNMNVVAWLCSRGFSYTKTLKKEEGIVFFFNDTETIRKEISTYVDNLEIQSFLIHQKRIRNEIVQKLRN
jgi:hypothetical protein